MFLFVIHQLMHAIALDYKPAFQMGRGQVVAGGHLAAEAVPPPVNIHLGGVIRVSVQDVYQARLESFFL